MRTRILTLLTCVALAGGVGFTATPSASAAPSAVRTITIGSLTLTRCDVAPRAYCGSIERPWGSGAAGNVTIGFAFVPAADQTRPALGTLVPHEGGPGASTTGSAEWYTDIYQPVMDRRNLLLVDQRGTGRSEPITCDPAQCPKTLGKRAYSYGTQAAADDLAALLDQLAIDTVDMYGDSYGTFFAQVFAGRHPERLRTLVLDAAYPVYGESAWYPTQGPALKRAFSVVCARGPLCAQETTRPDADLRRLIMRLRINPVRVNAPGADGQRHTFWLYPSAVALVAYSATYGTEIYQEFTAAVRAALSGDFVPMGRLVANAWWGDNSRVPPSEDSPGLHFAVSCHDYPQLFDLGASKDLRKKQLDAAVRRMQKQRPGIYAPFTIREYFESGWSSLDMCMDWPRATVPVGPPRPLGGSYSDVPTMILSGELDTITTAAEGAMVKSQFPHSVHVVVPNAAHVTASYRFSCGAMILRRVVTSGNLDLPDWLRACAEFDVRTVGKFARYFGDTEVAPGVSNTARNRLASAVLATWGDVINQWYVSATQSGVGLRGGTWTAAGSNVVRITMNGVRLSSDLPVNGRITLDFTTGVVSAAAALPGRSDIASLEAKWRLWANNATTELLIVRGSGTRARLTLPAP